MRSRRRSYHRLNRFDGPFAGRLITMLESPAFRVLTLSGHRVLARIERLTAKAVQWSVGGRDWEAAKRLAWGDLENEWHDQHGRRCPPWQCAGCDAAIGGSQALNLPDGNRVHFEPIDCLIRFGKRWRGAAWEALIAFGLEPPGLGGDQL